MQKRQYLVCRLRIAPLARVRRVVPRVRRVDRRAGPGPPQKVMQLAWLRIVVIARAVTKGCEACINPLFRCNDTLNGGLEPALRGNACWWD